MRSRVAAVVFPLLLLAGTASGQSGTEAAAPLYDIADTTTKDIALRRSFADSMGFWIPRLSVGRSILNGKSGHDTLLRDPGRRRLQVTASKPFQAGFARALEFYPFDSVQSPSHAWKFVRFRYDALEYNEAELGKAEAVYGDRAASGAEVAAGLALNYDAVQGRQLPNFYSWFTGQRGWRPFAKTEPRTTYIALTGHLFIAGAAHDTDAVFRVAVYHEVAAGRQYLDENFAAQTAGAGGHEYLVDSFAVTRGALRVGVPHREIGRYRTISRGVDLRWRYGGTSEPGPLHPDQPEGREQAIDVRVYWTGAEKAALRSVAVRDSVAEMLLGTSQASREFRENEILVPARGLFNGKGLGTIAHRVTAIVGLESGHESILRPMEFAGFEAVRQLLRGTFDLRFR